MTPSQSLVVLAAGIGSRYGGLKQLEPVGPNGETLVEYSFFDALRAGFSHAVLVVRPETEDLFRETYGSRPADGLEISYVHQTTDVPGDLSPVVKRRKPWGTAHAVLAVEGCINTPFALINADDFYGRDAFRALADFMAARRSDDVATFALAGFEVGPTLSDAGPVSRGLCQASEAGWLERIVEIPELAKDGGGGRFTDESGASHRVSGDELVSMNMWGFTPEIFRELKSRFRSFVQGIEGSPVDSSEFLIPDVVQGMIADGSTRVRVLRHDGRWCGITFPEDRAVVRRFIASLVEAGHYPDHLRG